MKIFFIIILLLIVQNIFGETKSSRWIDLEWDEVENAKGYDVSLAEVIDGKEYPRGNFQTDIPHWSKEENPGKFLLRIRARDSRNVPGAWGEPIEFIVKNLNPILLFPNNSDSFVKDENKANEIKFQWSEVKGVNKYFFQLKNATGKIISKNETNNTFIIIPIKNIGEYTWDVKNNPEDLFKSEENPTITKTFSIKGEKLKSPIIDINLNDSRGIIISWPEITRATSYSYSINSLNDTNQNQILLSETKKTTFGIPFSKIPQGKWFLSIKSMAKDYVESNDSRVIFNTIDNKTEIISNESITYEKNFRALNSSKLSFAIGYPSSKFINKNYELDTLNSENLRGIAINLSLSHAFWEKFNFYSSLEASQLANNNASINIYELKEQLRYFFGTRFINMQIGIGAGYKSLPNLYSNRLETPKVVSSSTFSTLNAVSSFQLNLKWNENFENELYADISHSMSKIGDSNTFSASNDISANFKTIYNINSKFNINVNYYFKKMENRYKAITGGSSFAIDGDINTSQNKFSTIMFGSEFFY